MKTRCVRLALIVLMTGLAWGCNDPAGPGMIEPDMYVRQILDARVVRDAIQLDMTMVIQECELDETRVCGTEEGLCQLGTEACTQHGLWSGECLGSVEPSDELCDFQDNDCDGLVDEVYRLGQTCKYTDERGFEQTGRVDCNVEEGVPYCRQEKDCSVDEDGDGSGVCQDCDDTDGQNFPGNLERCDNVDNDCDERIDETFDLDMACQVGQGLCRRGGMTVCAMNGTEVICDGEAGAPEDETCDGQDNDCDGNTDEGFQLMAMCTVGVGACTRPGIIACSAMGDAACMGEPGQPGNETCNEIDDDCDMNVDEGLALGEACTVGRGLCARQGLNRCNPEGDGTVTCSVEPGEPAGDEICDALDNDCDGVVDEGNPGGGGLCDTQRPGRCGEGLETCIEGAIICQPNAAGIPEVCNDIDDDCNEIVDDVPGRGEACSAGVGECARDGTRECTIGVGLVCTAEPADPIAEVCNGRDDDCDGSIDEGNPGGAVACETGEAGRCLIGSTTCLEGQLSCERVNAPAGEVCNNIDDNCNGLVDDVDGRGDACAVGVGACRREGTLQCVGNDLACSAREGQQVPERCDTIDNDCDGLADEDFALAQACTVGQGACESPGLTVCSPDGLDVVCEGEPGLAAVESCNGLDDDCDGRADEGNPESGGQCDTGQSGRCSDGLRNCRMGRLVCDRINEPLAELCNGLNDDCDADVDEDYDLDAACQRGVGLCREVGQLVCNANRDGTECSVDGGIAQNELCDGDDNDCDGTVDEGFNLGANCQAGVGRCEAFGSVVCGVDGSAGCNAEPLDPLPDELCNQVDDDCDGELDEGNPEGGDQCAVNNPGICAVGVRSCNEGNLSCVPAAQPGELPEVCDGQDNDCDNQIDEGNPGGGVVCQTQDLGACRNGTTQCAGAFLLCFADVAPSPETCDAVDNDCDGNVDEAFPQLGDPCDSDEAEGGDADLCDNGTYACNPENGGVLCADDFEVPEICDNRDNDCDGVIDNGFDKLSDVTNCGTCGRDCRDPDPLVPGEEYPNAACLGGACFQTFYVDETNGSNANGDGSEINPWRSVRFASRPTLDGGIDASDYAARIYVVPGRYAPDQWRDAIQCDGNNNGNANDDLCVTHTVACETDGNPLTVERCTECICDPSLACENGLCSLPESEQEDFPISMQDQVQIVGLGNRDHIIIDGGTRICFDNENDGNCNINVRNAPRATLVQAVDMADQDFQDEGSTCFDPDNPDCMDPDNPNFAFLSAQPNWHGRGSRNLLSNLTFLRGGRNNDSALLISTSGAYLNAGFKTSLRVQSVNFQKIKANQAYPVATAYDSDVFFDRILIQDSEGTGARGLVLLNRSDVTVDRSKFIGNDITNLGLGLFRASNSELNVRNSTFSNNTGGGVLFHTEGRGSVFHSTFAGNEYYNVVVAIGANAPTIIANNIFTATDNASSVFVHQNEEGGSSVHNNLFYESVGGFVSGRQTYSNVALLNARSWASDNLSGNPRIASIAGNNLSLTSDRSTAVEAASALPTAVPPSSVTQDPINGMIDCGADIDCINRNARDPKWNLAAYICDANLCVVDTILDEDGDGYPDWIEQIFGSDEFDVASWPPEYAVKEDFEGFSRPNGPDGEVPIRDVGAYEFEHPRE